MGSLRSLYADIHVPVPATPFKMEKEDTSESICKKIDKLFDDITNGYPDKTRQLVREMYYNNEGVFPLHRQAEEENAFATWQLFRDQYDPEGTHCVFIDQDLYPCQIVNRFCKIHEIAGHAGQAHQRISKAGFDTFIQEYQSGIFSAFTDQSVCLSEKMLVDALPSRLIAADLASSQSKPSAQAFMSEFLRLKKFSYGDYTSLSHRAEDCSAAQKLPAEYYDDFHKRPDVKKFDRYMCRKEKRENGRDLSGANGRARHSLQI